MKILTITCHNCYNYGAVLQTYALQSYLSRNYGESEVIDYVPRYMEYNSRYRYVPEKWSGSFIKKMLWYTRNHPRVFLLNGRKKRFDQFSEQYIHKTRRYSNYEELVNKTPKADVYICGSDQIWNGIDYENGKDNAFFLGFTSFGKKISYAASFGRSYVDEAFSQNKVRYLKEFQKISVRESSGIKILEAFQIDSVKVIDPVFLLDKKEWLGITAHNPAPSKQYVLIYLLDGNSQAIDLINEYKKEYDIVVLGELSLNEKGVRNIKDAGPIEFLEYIRNAKYIITNSFHCVAFSIIFEKNFLVLKRNNSINGRIDNLLNMAGISDVVIKDDISRILDYVQIGERIGNEISFSKKFLRDAIQDE